MRKIRCCIFLFLILLFVFIIYDIRQKIHIKQKYSPSIRYIMQYAKKNDPSRIEYQMVYNRWKRSDKHYNGVKTILYWNTMYVEKHRDFMFGKGDIFKDCNVKHCYATSSRRLFDSVDKYDAILFHGIEMNLFDLPRVRSSHQRYIFFSWESPLSRPINGHNFASWPNFYNWTMSYRLDSDIIRPYGIIRDILTDEIMYPRENDNDIVQWRYPNETYYPSSEELTIIRKKMRIAAWFVSHCETLSYRELLVDKLRQYMEVDIYGSCGTFECNRNKKEECYDLIEENYFYYLSFENTLCKDYITEKVFYPMSKYIIPVVYGSANYSCILPPHSYINTNDFVNIDELVSFMIDLISNPYEYASYFWWKKYYRIEDSNKFTLCNLCEKLHDMALPKKTLKDFRKYYIKDQCYEVVINSTLNSSKSP